MIKPLFIIASATLLLDAILQYLISSRTSEASLVRPFLYMQAILPTLFFAVVFLVRGFNMPRIINRRFTGGTAVYLFLVFSWWVLSALLGLVTAPRMSNVLLDLVRGISPFLVFLGLIASLSSAATYEKVQSDIIFPLFISLYGLIIAKTLLVFSGTYYGGGANQFAIPILTVIILIYSLIAPSAFQAIRIPLLPKKTKLFIFVLLAITLILTVFSLKREKWLVTLFAASSVILINLSKKNSITLLVLLAASSFTFLSLIGTGGQIDLLVQRFAYTFSGSAASGLDASSFERIAEIMGVLTTLGNDLGPFEYLTGHGNGAEYRMNPLFPFSDEGTGSAEGLFRHVHSMYFIILFRNGIIGLAIYTLPLLLQIWRDFSSLASRGKKPAPTSLALSVYAMCILISGIPANSAYGSIFYGFFLALSYVQHKGSMLVVNDVKSRQET